jgi:hypothetical protein
MIRISVTWEGHKWRQPWPKLMVCPCICLRERKGFHKSSQNWVADLKPRTPKMNFSLLTSVLLNKLDMTIFHPSYVSVLPPIFFQNSNKSTALKSKGGGGTVSIPDMDVKIFHWPATSSRTMAKVLTRPVSELRNNAISWWIRTTLILRLTTLLPSCPCYIEILGSLRPIHT